MPKYFLRLSIFFIVASLGLKGQGVSLSPYSLYGIGDLQEQWNPVQWSMGGMGATFQEAFHVNNFNPAGLPYLEMANMQLMMTFNSKVTEGPSVVNPVNSQGAAFNGLGIAFPIKKWWGSSISISPYSQIGYDIRTADSNTVSGEVDYVFKGEGGLNRLVWNNGFIVAKGLSVGLGAEYIFGTNRQTTSAFFEDPSFKNYKNDRSQYYSTFIFELGAQYKYQFNDTAYVTLGAVWQPSQNLSGRYEITDYTFDYNPASGNETPLDTAFHISSEDGEITFPNRYSFGINYGHWEEKLRGPSWQVGLEFQGAQWASFTDLNGTKPYRDSRRLVLGGSITPRYAFGSIARKRNFFNQMTYRAGAFYGETQLIQNDVAVLDRGVTMGLNVPFTPRNLAPGDQKLNYLNVGIVFGQRGNIDEGQIQETYWNIHFGVSFSDRWFQKFKYR